MAYRGEDVSAMQGAWGRQTPWQPSDDDHQAAAAADGGLGYRHDGGYPGQDQAEPAQPGYPSAQPGYGEAGPSPAAPGPAGYGPQDSYRPAYGQPQPYPPQPGYGQAPGHNEHAYGGQAYPEPQSWDQAGHPQSGHPQSGGDAEGYGGEAGYGQGSYGYRPGPASADGYGQAGPAGGYGQTGTAAGYGQADQGGYGARDSSAGYGQAGPDGYGHPGPADYTQAGPSDYGQAAPADYPQAGPAGWPGSEYVPDGGHAGLGGYPDHPGYAGENGYASGGYSVPGSGSYPGQASGGYSDPPAGSHTPGSGYPGTGAYPGHDGYSSPDNYSSPNGYSGPNGYGQSGAYPAGAGTEYPALPGPPGGTGGQDGGYPGPDAGNDWYGGQPAAARGASFADTGTYQFNGRVADEYGTGSREAVRDRDLGPARGYPPMPAPAPNSGQPSGELPTSVIPAVGGPQTGQRSGPQATQLSGPLTAQRTGPQAAQRTGPLAAQRSGPQDGFDDYGTRAYAAPGYGAPAEQDLSQPGLAAGDAYADFATIGAPRAGRYGNDAPTAGIPGGKGGAGRSGGGGRKLPGPLRGRRWLLATAAVIVVGIVLAAVYVFVLKPPPAATPATSGPLPTASNNPSQQACAAQLGTYCHIETRADDPTALTTAELFPPEFTNETDKVSYSEVSSKTDKTCSSAVIGSSLIKALKADQCTQVLRASYVSGNNKIMGTVGVVNLSTTTDAQSAGKGVGQSDFIAPLTSAKGVASKLGNGTGLVTAEYKGHYLILTWSEFVNGTNPSSTAEDKQLEQFGNDLIAGTANVTLSQRMVNGDTASATTGASASASPSATK